MFLKFPIFLRSLELISSLRDLFVSSQKMCLAVTERVLRRQGKGYPSYIAKSLDPCLKCGIRAHVWS